MTAKVWLEVDGKLRICQVGDPYSGWFQALNSIPKDASIAVIDHFRTERKRIAAEVVAKGAYQVCNEQGDNNYAASI